MVLNLLRLLRSKNNTNKKIRFLIETDFFMLRNKSYLLKYIFLRAYKS